MGYDLSPKNKDLDSFHFGAFSWPHLLEQCGYLFTVVQNGGRWYCAFGTDKRMGDTYPMLISNDGFKVTAFEAKVMARVARNYALVQGTLEAPPEQKEPCWLGNNDWPQKIRDDWPKRFEEFADWADKSGGFRIW